MNEINQSECCMVGIVASLRDSSFDSYRKKNKERINCFTVMILNFWTDRSGQTVQTQIRLLLEEQPDQGLHCLLSHLHAFDKMPSGLAHLFEF